MSKHTKGPWAIQKDKGHNWEVNRLIGGEGENLGDLYLAPRVGEEAEYEANAKLIATAPELLDALREAVKDVEAVHEACGIALPYWFAACEAALNKATSISN